MDVKVVRCKMWAGFMWLGIRSSWEVDNNLRVSLQLAKFLTV
jgi:hypothetical protein